MRKKNVIKLFLAGAFLLFSVNASPYITMSKLIKKTITIPIPPNEDVR